MLIDTSGTSLTELIYKLSFCLPSVPETGRCFSNITHWPNPSLLQTYAIFHLSLSITWYAFGPSWCCCCRLLVHFQFAPPPQYGKQIAYTSFARIAYATLRARNIMQAHSSRYCQYMTMIRTIKNDNQTTSDGTPFRPFSDCVIFKHFFRALTMQNVEKKAVRNSETTNMKKKNWKTNIFTYALSSKIRPCVKIGHRRGPRGLLGLSSACPSPGIGQRVRDSNQSIGPARFHNA